MVPVELRIGRRERGWRLWVYVLAIASLLLFGAFRSLMVCTGTPPSMSPSPRGDYRSIALAETKKAEEREQARRDEESMELGLTAMLGASVAVLVGLRLTRRRGTITIDRRGLRVSAGREQRSLEWSNLVSAFWDSGYSTESYDPAHVPDPTMIVARGVGVGSDNWVVELRDDSGAPPIVLDGRDFYKPHVAYRALREALPSRFPRG